MEIVGAFGSGHGVLEDGKAKSSWVNTWKADVNQRKGAWEKPHFSSWDCIPVPIRGV
jgi:hypothetical protein